ncbi:DUF1318 domain-containing protein [Sphingomonas tabacisoli]|uniref:DUF1318 domain-containing protein n=1 Tax=Sphingomonas tabacisoli TaxID=2249466 RepID=A0ABW4I5J0_9SPHN
MTKRGKIIMGVAGLALLAVSGVAFAQAGVSAAIAAGQVGERADGYLGIRGEVAGPVRAEVEQINIKRRALYTSRAGERGVAVEAIAAATACQAMQRVGVGQAYNLGGGWAVRGSGDPAPKPANCP